MYLANMETESKDIETIRKYRHLFKTLKDFCLNKGIRFVKELDLPTLEQFRATWKDGDLSRQKKQERLRSVFRYAHSRKMIDENPALGLGKISVKITQKIPFTDEEMDAILAAAVERCEDKKRSDAERERSRRAYALILVMRYTGLRISDATLLARSSVKGNHITLVTEKTDTPVSVYVGDTVIEALQSFTPETKTHYFWNSKIPLKSLTNLYRDFYLAPVFEAAGLTGKTPHQFRHTFASKLLSSRVSVDHVAALLGNSAKMVLKHYAKWVPARQEALDEDVMRANGWHHLASKAK